MSALELRRAGWLDRRFWDRLDRLESHHQRIQSAHNEARRGLERLGPGESAELRGLAALLRGDRRARADHRRIRSAAFVHGLKRPVPGLRILSRQAIGELGALEASVQQLGTHRSAALRLFLISRNATTSIAQQEFWLEFSSIDREYRTAIRRLAEFCAAHRSR